VGQGSGMGGGAIETRAAVRAARDQKKHAPICVCTQCVCERAGTALEMSVWEDRMQDNRDKMLSCLNKVRVLLLRVVLLPHPVHTFTLSYLHSHAANLPVGYAVQHAIGGPAADDEAVCGGAVVRGCRYLA
jgi:hypothetical protein